MRFEGTIKSWNEDRAFGFIEPRQGGQDIFVHLTAFQRRVGRPSVNQLVSFEVELNDDGKKRAKNVQLVSSARAASRRPSNSAAGWGGATLFTVPLFAMFYLVLAVIWHVPNTVGIAYLAFSVACFFFYSSDKSAARSRGQRIPERTLLLLGAFGGWPGAVLAQQFLCHKSVKASFRATFWGTVWLNIGVFVGLSSPYGGAWSWLK